MTSNQRQSASDGSQAVQAGNDVTINNGLSPAQMVEILDALSAHVEKLGATAREIVDERLSSFEKGVLARFATDDTARSEAFRDPDFQAATLDAQKAYARSGDEGLKDVLIDLLASRSKITNRSRLSLSLNDAIAKVGVIPESDLNLLSLIFLFQNVQNKAICNVEGLVEFLSDTSIPLLANLSISDSAIHYLTAHGCVIPPTGISQKLDILDILFTRYGYLVTEGMEETELKDSFHDYDLLCSRGLIIDSPYGKGLKVFNIAGPRLDEILAAHGIAGSYGDKYKELASKRKPNPDEFRAYMTGLLPEFDKLWDVYNSPLVRNSSLTSIGIALGHANLSTGIFRNASLSIWIKE